MSWHSSYEPLRVRAYLQCGVVSDEYLPLDGILFYQAMREQYGARMQSRSGGGVEDAKLRAVSMPLELRRARPNEAVWWYACSFACTRAGAPQWWLAEGQDHWNKRFDAQYADAIDFETRRGKVIIEKGHYRAYHMPIFYRVAEEIHWYCVGDKTRIQELLLTVTHIGKKQTQGWGRVNGWTVESFDQDWSCWRAGLPMRALPVSEIETPTEFSLALKLNTRYYGLHPSYYDYRNQARCFVP